MFSKGEIRIGLNKDDSVTYYQSVNSALFGDRCFIPILELRDISQVLNFIELQIKFVFKAVKEGANEIDIPQPFLDAFGEK